MYRRIALSRESGFAGFSDGKTQSLGSPSGSRFNHSSMFFRTESDKAATRTDFCVFGESISPRYIRALIAAPCSVKEPRCSAKISPGRIPAIAFERGLRNYLVKNLGRIEPG